MATPRVPKELADAWSLPQDPAAFFRGVMRKGKAPIVELINRTRARLGVDHYDAPDQRNPKLVHRLSLKASTKDNPDELGLRFAVLAFRVPKGGETLADEARRMALGLKRGLDGEYLGPDARALMGTGIHPDARSLFGIDDAILLGILAAAAPILVAIVPFVLPMLLDAAEGLFATIAPGTTLPGSTKAKEEEAAAEAEARAAAEGRQKQKLMRNVMIAGGLAAGLGLLWYIVAKKG